MTEEEREYAIEVLETLRDILRLLNVGVDKITDTVAKAAEESENGES